MDKVVEFFDKVFALINDMVDKIFALVSGIMGKVNGEDTLPTE